MPTGSSCCTCTTSAVSAPRHGLRAISTASACGRPSIFAKSTSEPAVCAGRGPATARRGAAARLSSTTRRACIRPMTSATIAAMAIEHRPRIGLRSALVALIVASVVPFGLLLHFTWWRTATKVSHDLVETLERQITDSVRRTWWGRVLEVQGLSQVVSEAAAVPGGPLNVERVLVASAASSPALSWVLHIPKEGEILALQELGPHHTRLFRVDRDGRITAIADLGRDPPREPAQATHGASLAIFGQPWLVEASGWSEAGWVEAPQTPDGKDRAVAYVDPSGGAALVFMIGFDRFAKLLGDIAVGRTGRSFVVCGTWTYGSFAEASQHPPLSYGGVEKTDEEG